MKKYKPEHAFPLLVHPQVLEFAGDPMAALKPRTPHQRKILEVLQNGGQVVFDMHQKRALLCKGAFQAILELGVRTLAWLVKSGALVLRGRQGRLVVYGPSENFYP